MNDTWFSIGFIVFSSWPYYKEGFEVSSLNILWVGLRFHAHLLKNSSRPAMKTRETLGRRKNQRSNQIEVRKLETGKYQCARVIRRTHGRTIRPLHSDDPTLTNVRQTMARSILQRAYFPGSETSSTLGWSDAIRCIVGLYIRLFSREIGFQAGKFPSGLDYPTLGS